MPGSVIGLIISLIVTGVGASKHNTAKIATNAKNYIQDFHLTTKEDQFLNTHTTQIRIDTDSSSGGHSSGGGFSSHSGSSGHSHGGGGRHF